MEIEEIQTWQWMLAGLIAGLLFSCVVSWSGPGFDTQTRDTIEQGEFEDSSFALTKFRPQDTTMRGLLLWAHDQYEKTQPLLRDVTVHPPIASDTKHYWVTGQFYSVELKRATKAGDRNQVVRDWKPFRFAADIPYKPGYQLLEEKKQRAEKEKQVFRNTSPWSPVLLAELRKSLGDKSSFATVADFLQAVKQLPNSHFDYRYAWWELPRFIWTMPPLAGFLMIGVAWPLALSVLRNLGLAKAAPVRVKHAPVKKPVRSSTTAMPAGVVLHPVTPAAPPPPQEHVEYGGEFYPVVKTTHKE